MIFCEGLICNKNILIRIPGQSGWAESESAFSRNALSSGENGMAQKAPPLIHAGGSSLTDSRGPRLLLSPPRLTFFFLPTEGAGEVGQGTAAEGHGGFDRLRPRRDRRRPWEHTPHPLAP